MHVHDLPTPALVVDADALEHNLATMARAHPGAATRPHVKAHKCTELARRQHAYHPGFTCATPREAIGLVRAGLTDVLVANEVIDPARLAALAGLDADITIAVDSDVTIDAAANAGIRRVLIDVNVGLPRCGCAPDAAGRLADRARARGLDVLGVMGYEGHVVGLEDRAARVAGVEAAAAILAEVREVVGGDVVSGGGTGTWDLADHLTELQAGSYALMDTAYLDLDLPFRPALGLETTVISVSEGGTVASGGWAVVDCGLKSLDTGHGDPSIDGAIVWSCSDEHTILSVDGGPAPRVGDRITVWPRHVDPTVALHERMHLVDADGTVVETWPVDLRGW